jgi:hypothetical protein
MPYYVSSRICILRDASSASCFQIYRNSNLKVCVSKYISTKEYGETRGEVLCIYLGGLGRGKSGWWVSEYLCKSGCMTLNGGMIDELSILSCNRSIDGIVGLFI